MSLKLANAGLPIRIARPSRDLARAEQFYVSGLGLSVLYRHDAAPGVDEASLRILGWLGASWHLELTHNLEHPLTPTPTSEDLLAVYLGERVPSSLLEQLEAHGGIRVKAHNPYWDTWGVTVADPDGYRLVLCERIWNPS